MNLRQKHYALLKLAQVKKAMRFVLTKRAMKKQAADNPPVQYSPGLEKLMSSLPPYGGDSAPKTDPLDNLPDIDPSNYWDVQNPDGKLNYWEPWDNKEGNNAIRDLFHQQTGTKAKPMFKGKNFATPLTLGDTGVPVGMDATLLPDDTGAILGGLNKYFKNLDALEGHRDTNGVTLGNKDRVIMPGEGVAPSPVDWNWSLYPDTPHPRLPEYGLNSLGLEGYDADNAALNSTAYNWAGNPTGDISENLPAVDNVKSIPSRFSHGGLLSALTRSDSPQDNVGQRLLSNLEGFVPNDDPRLVSAVQKAFAQDTKALRKHYNKSIPDRTPIQWLYNGLNQAANTLGFGGLNYGDVPYVPPKSIQVDQAIQRQQGPSRMRIIADEARDKARKSIREEQANKVDTVETKPLSRPKNEQLPTPPTMPSMFRD